MKTTLKYDLILPVDYVLKYYSVYLSIEESISSIPHDIIDKYTLHQMNYSCNNDQWFYHSSSYHVSSYALTFLDILLIVEKFNKNIK